MAGWMVSWLTGWLADRLDGWLDGWMVSWMVSLDGGHRLFTKKRNEKKTKICHYFLILAAIFLKSIFPHFFRDILG